MSILGWVLAWCGSGLNSVTVDFGAEINKELSFRYAIISSRYLFTAILYVRYLDSCGPHGYVISIADPLDWLCRYRHISNVEAEEWRWQVGALRGRPVLTFLDAILHLWSKSWLVFLSDNMTAIALWPGGAVICWSSTADCYGKLCQTQPINLQLRKSFDQRASSGWIPLRYMFSHLQQSWGGRMIWSKTVLVWSRLELFVDSGQNQRLQ